VYVAVVEGVPAAKVPQAFPVQLPPLAVQVTPSVPTSFVTLAVKFSVCETGIPPRFGVKVTLTPLPTVMVIVADADFVPSAKEVAVNVTAELGTLGGAV
jgi:hypothetical protein